MKKKEGPQWQKAEYAEYISGTDNIIRHQKRRRVAYIGEQARVLRSSPILIQR